MFDDRAVSEVLGFVLVFGLIFGSVGLLYMVGFSSITDYQEGEQMRNANQAFEAIAENFNDLQRNDGVEARSSEISHRGGMPSVDEETTNVTISVEDNSGGEVVNETVQLGALTYSFKGTTIAYEGGGVFRERDGGSVTIKEPLLKCREDANGETVAIVSLTKVLDGGVSLQDSPTQEIRAKRGGSEVLHTGGLNDLEITVEDSPYEDAWDRLTEPFNDECGNADRGTIRVTEISIEVGE